jgi:hypothetical protein
MGMEINRKAWEKLLARGVHIFGSRRRIALEQQQKIVARAEGQNTTRLIRKQDKISQSFHVRTNHTSNSILPYIALIDSSLGHPNRLPPTPDKRWSLLDNHLDGKGGVPVLRGHGTGWFLHVEQQSL